MNYTRYNHQGKEIYLIDMKLEKEKVFSEMVKKWIEKYVKLWKSIAIIVNKKWYSSWRLCHDCWYVHMCNNCDVSVAYHRTLAGQEFWLCHICKQQYNVPESCPNCWGFNIKEYGYGIQKVQELLLRDFWLKSFAVETQTASSVKKIQNVFEQIQLHQIVVWTSLLATPFYKKEFDLVIFLNADIGLNIPDFNANFSNFWLLYETFKKHNARAFLVQSFNPEAASIKYACGLDFEGYKAHELEYRKNFAYAPDVQMCCLLYKEETEEKVFNKVNKLYQELLYLKEASKTNVEIYATPALIYKMFGKYRYTIILKWKDIRAFMDKAFVDLKVFSKGFKVDRNPQNLV